METVDVLSMKGTLPLMEKRTQPFRSDEARTTQFQGPPVLRLGIDANTCGVHVRPERLTVQEGCVPKLHGFVKIR